MPALMKFALRGKPIQVIGERIGDQIDFCFGSPWEHMCGARDELILDLQDMERLAEQRMTQKLSSLGTHYIKVNRSN